MSEGEIQVLRAEVDSQAVASSLEDEGWGLPASEKQRLSCSWEKSLQGLGWENLGGRSPNPNRPLLSLLGKPCAP